MRVNRFGASTGGGGGGLNTLIDFRIRSEEAFCDSYPFMMMLFPKQWSYLII
jgi:hypothetical protein